MAGSRVKAKERSRAASNLLCLAELDWKAAQKVLGKVLHLPEEIPPKKDPDRRELWGILVGVFKEYPDLVPTCLTYVPKRIGELRGKNPGRGKRSSKTNSGPDPKAANPASEEEPEDDRLTQEEVEALRLKPCRHCGEPFVRGHRCAGMVEETHREGFDDEEGLRKKKCHRTKPEFVEVDDDSTGDTAPDVPGATELTTKEPNPKVLDTVEPVDNDPAPDPEPKVLETAESDKEAAPSQKRRCGCLVCAGSCTETPNEGYEICYHCHIDHGDQHRVTAAAARCELHVSDCCDGFSKTFEVREGGWKEWLLHLTDGKMVVKMCENCFNALLDLLRAEAAKETWEGLIAFSEKVGRPVPECVLKLEGCQGRTVRTAYAGAPFGEQIARLLGAEEAPCCVPCKEKLASAAKTAKFDDLEPLQQIFEAKGIPFAPPAPGPVKEKAELELVSCVDCGATAGLVSVADGEEPVCNFCSLIRNAVAKGAPEGRVRHAKSLRNKGKLAEALGYLVQILREATEESWQTTEAAAETEVEAVVVVEVSEEALGGVQVAKGSSAVIEEEAGEPKERMEIDWKSQPKCPDCFKRQGVRCMGHIPPIEGADMCKACHDFRKSLAWYNPDEWVEEDKTYWIYCKECGLAWSIPGSVLVDLGKPPKNTLLCGPCLKVRREVAEAAEHLMPAARIVSNPVPAMAAV